MLINNEKDVLFSSSEGINCIKAYLQQRGLSKRESEVVILVVQGLTNKQVANRLCVAEKTVKFHLTNVYKRMKISRRSEIIWSLPLAEFMEKAKTTTPTPATAHTMYPTTSTKAPIGPSTTPQSNPHISNMRNSNNISSNAISNDGTDGGVTPSIPIGSSTVDDSY